MNYKAEGVPLEYIKLTVIALFKEVALGSEFGNEFKKLTKWHSPMYIYVDGVKDEYLISELERIIQELNDLFLDGFRIQIVETKDQSNFHLFFGSADNYSALYPEIKNLLPENFGLFQVRFDEHFEIQGGNMYVDVFRPDREEQMHILREELTQSLGLANDNSDSRSIFHQMASLLTEYSPMDTDFIRLLYHPRMKAGYDERTIEITLESILGLN